MFELGVLALDRALARGAFRGWELHGIGTVEAGRRVSVGGGAALDMLPRAAQGDYAARAARARRRPGADAHPPPQPRADRDGLGGHAHVTNSFENKTAGGDGGDLAEHHGRRAGDRGGGRRAVRGVGARGDLDRRVAGSAVDWSRELGRVVRRRGDGPRRGACSGARRSRPQAAPVRGRAQPPTGCSGLAPTATVCERAALRRDELSFGGPRAARSATILAAERGGPDDCSVHEG